MAQGARSAEAPNGALECTIRIRFCRASIVGLEFRSYRNFLLGRRAAGTREKTCLNGPMALIVCTAASRLTHRKLRNSAI